MNVGFIEIKNVVYVDDRIVVDKNTDNTNEEIYELNKIGYEIEDKSTISEYLGVYFKCKMYKSFELTQAKLIQKIIEDSEVLME